LEVYAVDGCWLIGYRTLLYFRGLFGWMFSLLCRPGLPGLDDPFAGVEEDRGNLAR